MFLLSGRTYREKKVILPRLVRHVRETNPCGGRTIQVENTCFIKARLIIGVKVKHINKTTKLKIMLELMFFSKNVCWQNPVSCWSLKFNALFFVLSFRPSCSWYMLVQGNKYRRCTHVHQ